MIDFEFDPEEDVNRAGAGHMSLRQAVREIMATPADERGFVMLYRESGKEPSCLEAEQIEELAALPHFKVWLTRPALKRRSPPLRLASLPVLDPQGRNQAL